MTTANPLAGETVMASMSNTEGVILDGMAPHVWLGPSASKDCYRDVLVESVFTLNGARVTQTGARSSGSLFVDSQRAGESRHGRGRKARSSDFDTQ